jgi:hypothetical protein
MAYTPMSNVSEDRVAKAEEVKTQIVRVVQTSTRLLLTSQIEYMQKQIAEQLGVDVNPPYASGKFDIAHSVEGSELFAALNF